MATMYDPNGRIIKAVNNNTVKSTNIIVGHFRVNAYIKGPTFVDRYERRDNDGTVYIAHFPLPESTIRPTRQPIHYYL